MFLAARMKTIFGIFLTLITVGLVAALFYSIIFGRKDAWLLPLGLLIVFWFGGNILFSILHAIFGFRV